MRAQLAATAAIVVLAAGALAADIGLARTSSAPSNATETIYVVNHAGIFRHAGKDANGFYKGEHALGSR